MNKQIISIDLGTTNSLVSVWQNGAAQLIPNALGEILTPSVIGVDDDDSILVGQPAKERLITHPQLTIANFKRLMGTNKNITLGKFNFRPEELSALVLKRLKEDAEAYLQHEITEAIISVPAYFNDTQRKATKIAGELAGLHVERLLNEPTAASLAYGLHEDNDEAKFFVIDLGGGTFDVSILDYFDGVMEIMATAGDNYLGGEDFTQLIFDDFFDELLKPLGYIKDSLPDKLRANLYAQAESAKKILSNNPQALLYLHDGDKQFQHQIDADKFNSLAAPLLERIKGPIRIALRDSGLNPLEIDYIVIVGGATRMPIIKNMVTTLFDQNPVCSLNPDEVVARGAAVQAGLKMRDKALQEFVVTDVCPFTLGTDCLTSEHATGQDRLKFAPIIERNTVIPTSRVKSFYNSHDNQTQVRIGVYQGESFNVDENIELGELTVDVPPKPRNDVELQIRFTYDINGLLEVDVFVPLTNLRETLLIQNNPGVLTEEEIQEKLAQLQVLKIHPRNETENRTLLAKAESYYSNLLGDMREEIGHDISYFKGVLGKQDPKEIRRAQKWFKEKLASLDEHML